MHLLLPFCYKYYTFHCSLIPFQQLNFNYFKNQAELRFMEMGDSNKNGSGGSSSLVRFPPKRGQAVKAKILKEVIKVVKNASCNGECGCCASSSARVGICRNAADS